MQDRWRRHASTWPGQLPHTTAQSLYDDLAQMGDQRVHLMTLAMAISILALTYLALLYASNGRAKTARRLDWSKPLSKLMLANCAPILAGMAMPNEKPSNCFGATIIDNLAAGTLLMDRSHGYQWVNGFAALYRVTPGEDPDGRSLLAVIESTAGTPFMTREITIEYDGTGLVDVAETMGDVTVQQTLEEAIEIFWRDDRFARCRAHGSALCPCLGAGGSIS